MDLSFSADEQAFRAEVRAWVREALPEAMRDKARSGARYTHVEHVEWHRILYAKGWAAPHWPAEVGGAALDATRRFILTEELDLAGAPHLSPFGLNMVGPLIINFGTPEQKARFLPKILSGEEVWCQGYSEPEAGSDLASLRMSAVRDGDSFVVNGQKTWTTYGQFADWIFCLVRTDTEGPKQAGISFLLIDMKTPGVDVKPMLTLSGEPAFCDTYFSDVRVPAENLLGPLNGGWMLAKTLLLHERTLVGAVGPIRRTLARIKELARVHGDDGSSLSLSPRWRDEIAELEIRLRAHQVTNYRVLATQAAGGMPGPEASILKLVASTLQQQADELLMDMAGAEALVWRDPSGVRQPMLTDVGQQYCYNRATTIYAGSNEIQKNIIAKLVLGLPRS